MKKHKLKLKSIWKTEQDKHGLNFLTFGQKSTIRGNSQVGQVRSN